MHSTTGSVYATKTMAHQELVGRRCISRATGRLGTIDRTIPHYHRSTEFIVIFDDGETHKGFATEFLPVRRIQPLNDADLALITKLRIERWNPCDFA